MSAFDKRACWDPMATLFVRTTWGVPATCTVCCGVERAVTAVCSKHTSVPQLGQCFVVHAHDMLRMGGKA